MSRGNQHYITVDGKTFQVDSNQEEVLIRWAEANGFHDRWMRRDYGVSRNGNNYTPDLELAVQLDGMTHRAIVESKPELAAFNSYISRRMRGIARHYYTELLLLYVHDTKTWYRIDIKTGALSNFGVPTPGINPISASYKPWTKKAPRVYAHTYRQRIEFGKIVLNITADVLEGFVKLVVGPPKRGRRRRRR